MKKTSLIIGLSLMVVISTTPLIYAQNGPDYGAPAQGAPAGQNGAGGNGPLGNNQQLICRGDRDFTTFLSAVLSYDDFVEYWKDILVRFSANYCQYLDISNMLNQITKVRAQLRNAFYTCGDTRKLKDTYYNLEAELYFLRNVINADNGQFLQMSDAELLNGLKDNFVLNKNYFSDQQINDIFTKLKDKYAGKLKDYKECKLDDNWGKLVDKWKEFKDNVVTMFTDPKNNPILKEASASISQHYEKMANTSMNLGRSFFGGFLDLKINGLSPAEGWDLISQEFQKNSPSGYTFEQIKVAKDNADQKYQEDTFKVSSIVNYQMMYLETSDEYTKTYVGRLNTLSDIITSTYPFENQTINCVKSVNSKTC